MLISFIYNLPETSTLVRQQFQLKKYCPLLLLQTVLLMLHSVRYADLVVASQSQLTTLAPRHAITIHPCVDVPIDGTSEGAILGVLQNGDCTVHSPSVVTPGNESDTFNVENGHTLLFGATIVEIKGPHL